MFGHGTVTAKNKYALKSFSLRQCPNQEREKNEGAQKLRNIAFNKQNVFNMLFYSSSIIRHFLVCAKLSGETI